MPSLYTNILKWKSLYSFFAISALCNHFEVNRSKVKGYVCSANADWPAFGGRQVGQWNSVKGLTYSLSYQTVSQPAAFTNRSLVVTTILVSYTLTLPTHGRAHSALATFEVLTKNGGNRRSTEWFLPSSQSLLALMKRPAPRINSALSSKFKRNRATHG